MVIALPIHKVHVSMADKLNELVGGTSVAPMHQCLMNYIEWWRRRSLICINENTNSPYRRAGWEGLNIWILQGFIEMVLFLIKGSVVCGLFIRPSVDGVAVYIYLHTYIESTVNRSINANIRFSCLAKTVVKPNNNCLSVAFRFGWSFHQESKSGDGIRFSFFSPWIVDN